MLWVTESSTRTSRRDSPLYWVNAHNYSSPNSRLSRTGIPSPQTSIFSDSLNQSNQSFSSLNINEIFHFRSTTPRRTFTPSGRTTSVTLNTWRSSPICSTWLNPSKFSYMTRRSLTLLWACLPVPKTYNGTPYPATGSKNSTPKQRKYTLLVHSSPKLIRADTDDSKRKFKTTSPRVLTLTHKTWWKHTNCLTSTRTGFLKTTC